MPKTVEKLSSRVESITKYDLRVLSLGAGTQSSALLLLAIREELPERFLPLDAAIFADTGDEPQEVYDWLRVLDREAAGKVPIHVVSAGARLSDVASRSPGEEAPMSAVFNVPAFVRDPESGAQGIAGRSCTRDFKIGPIRRKVRELVGSGRDKKVLQLIGMSVDEVHRMKPSGVGYIDHAWPLIDMRWRRQTSINYIEGLQLGTPPRSACVFCPFHSDNEWRRLRDTDPEGWKHAVEFDERLRAANREWRDSDESSRAYRGDLFVHRSLLPLAEVDLSTEEDHGQGAFDLWANECEGMCGV